jgi:hypothetical protein
VTIGSTGICVDAEVAIGRIVVVDECIGLILLVDVTVLNGEVFVIKSMAVDESHALSKMVDNMIK